MGQIIELPKKKKRIIEANQIVWGDCLDWLDFVEKGTVDVCYIDPPFFSNRKYEIIWGNGYELRSFDDRWKGRIQVYINWMKERVEKIREVLKPTGSIFLHCDWRASHRLRVMLDEVFGEENFVNEIICLGDLTGRPPEKYLKIDTQTILWYSKDTDQYRSVKDKMIIKEKIDKNSNHHYQQYPNGRYGYDMPQGDYSEETLKKKEKEGTAFKNHKGKWRVIKYLEEKGNHLVREHKND